MTDEKQEGNPFVGNELCMERREFMSQKIDNMETKILFTIKLSTLLVGLVVTILQLGLHYLG